MSNIGAASDSSTESDQSNESASSDYSSSDDDELDDECEEIDLSEEDPMCLLCEKKISLEHVFVHLNDEHKLDVFQLRQKFKMDQEAYIKLVNYVRNQAKIVDSKVLVETLMTCTIPLWNNESYLQPVLSEDTLLTFWFESEAQETNDDNTVEATQVSDPSVTNDASLALTSENCELRRKNLEYENALSDAYDKLQKMQEVMNRICLDTNSRSIQQILRKDTATTESDYFASYDDIGIHDQMLTDTARTDAYQQAIIRNETDFKNKTVLDVGCGTGILSMFAAKAGASKVFAVDRSKILDKAVQIIRENGFENIIECIRGTVESIKLPVDKVDIIISEWMGYFLLYEGMLSSVIEARKRFLKSDGSIYPNTSDLFIQGISDEVKLEERSSKWENVYGFKMTCLSDRTFSSVDPVDETVCVTAPVNILSLDLMTCENEDTAFEKKFTFKVARQCKLTAIIGYFDVAFTMGSTFTNVLSTSPKSPTTHWMQSVFYLQKPISVEKGDELEGVFGCRPNSKNPRWLDFTLTLAGDTYSYQMK